MDGMDGMVNGDTRCHRGRRRQWPQRASVLAITASVAVLAAACSGSPSSAGGGGSSNAGGSGSSQLLAFAQCMRSHSVASFPDPTSDLKFPDAQQLGVSNSVYQSAYAACHHLLPNGGTSSSQAEVQQQMNGMREISRCMRSHGWPNFPDPTLGSQGHPEYNLVGVPGANTPSAEQQMLACARLLPHKLPLGGIGVVQ